MQCEISGRTKIGGERVTRFEAVKLITNEQTFSELLFDLIAEYGTKDEFAKFLSEDMTEEQLQTLKSIAASDYPLSLERMQ